MKKLEKSFNKIIIIEMCYSFFYFILGLILFFKSNIANNLAGMFLGLFIFLAGLINIYKYIDKSKIKLFKSSLIIGFTIAILGIIIMLNPIKTIDILNIGMGIWILIEGINKFMLFFELKKIKDVSNKLFLVSSLLLVFMGIVIILNPFRSTIITKTIGTFIMLYSILNLNDLVLLKRRSKNIIKLFK